MAQGVNVTGTKEKEKIKRMVYRRDERQSKQSLGGRHRRTEDMERIEPRGDRSMLEEVGRKNGRRKFWTSTRLRIAKGLTEAEGAPLEWRRARRSRKCRIRKWREDCWARIFARFRDKNLQRRQSMYEDSKEEKEMKRQPKMKVVKDM